MSKGESRPETTRGMRIVYAVLIVLIILTAGAAVTIRLLGSRRTQPSSVMIPNNVIGGVSGALASAQEDGTLNGFGPGGVYVAPASGDSSVPAAYLELFQGQESDNKPFQTADMLPGDRAEQYYCLKAYHNGPVTLEFKTAVTAETKALSDVMKLRVTDLNTKDVLYDGAFTGADELFTQTLAGTGGSTTVYYKVEAYLDTAVGNDYQQASLKANFIWEVKDSGGPTVSTSTTATTVTTISTTTTATTATTNTTSTTDTTATTDTTSTTDTTAAPPTSSTATPDTTGSITDTDATTVTTGTDTTTATGGGLTPPPTGEDAGIVLALGLAATALAATFLLLLVKNRRERHD